MKWPLTLPVHLVFLIAQIPNLPEENVRILFRSLELNTLISRLMKERFAHCDVL